MRVKKEIDEAITIPIIPIHTVPGLLGDSGHVLVQNVVVAVLEETLK